MSLTGFYKEWLRDGVVIEGPTWVAGSPGDFTYIAQEADANHAITSAVQPCNAEGCYGSYAVSSSTYYADVPAEPADYTVDGN